MKRNTNLFCESQRILLQSHQIGPGYYFLFEIFNEIFPFHILFWVDELKEKKERATKFIGRRRRNEVVFGRVWLSTLQQQILLAFHSTYKTNAFPVCCFTRREITWQNSYWLRVIKISCGEQLNDTPIAIRTEPSLWSLVPTLWNPQEFRDLFIAW